MSNLYELTAELRQEIGKGASRRLRRVNDRVPAILYGGGEPAQPLSFEHNKLSKALENEKFYTRILTIHIDGKKQQAVLKDLQRHPYKPRIAHMDLLRITGKEKITMTIPLHFKGDDVAPGVKVGGGVVSHLISSVEVRCLPANLPEYIDVDASNLELDQAIHLSQLPLPAGVELVALAHGNDLPVVSVHIPRAVVEPETTAAPEVSAEVPATAQTAPEPAAAGGDEKKEKGKEKK